jgi:hypothetical protein
MAWFEEQPILGVNLGYDPECTSIRFGYLLLLGIMPPIKDIPFVPVAGFVSESFSVPAALPSL